MSSHRKALQDGASGGRVLGFSVRSKILPLLALGLKATWLADEERSRVVTGFVVVVEGKERGSGET